MGRIHPTVDALVLILSMGRLLSYFVSEETDALVNVNYSVHFSNCCEAEELTLKQKDITLSKQLTLFSPHFACLVSESLDESQKNQ